MLGDARLTAFVATANATRSKTFYERTLGLRLVGDDSVALVFDANGTELRIQKVENVQPPPFTVLGWQVADLRKAMAGLSKRGVKFERYAFLEQDNVGIWLAPGGAKVAWFKDPDGNLLSVAQYEAA
jgi:catechol 2,3-dioxygenase-like lactoylglutathione lyase family enzyme